MIFDEEYDWGDPETVFEIVMFRLTSSNEEWGQDPASTQWDLTREEAYRRLEAEDYSSPLPL